MLPLGLLGNKFLLSLKVACDNIFGLDYKLASKQVVSPCVKIMNHCSHLLFLHFVLPLNVIELPAFKGN